MSETIISQCQEILNSLNIDKPWMTAAALARRTDQSVTHLEQTLIAHSQSPGRKIRHSHYPGRKTLSLLWGHIDVVGEKGNLAQLHRYDSPDEDLAIDASLPEDAPWYFLSHNYRDFGKALQIRDLLLSKGCGAWLFETEIPERGVIVNEVVEALQQCSGFIALVTRSSMGSLWVQKEIEVARRQGFEVHLVLDGSDPELLQLFEQWKHQWPPEREATQSFCTIAAEDIGQSENSVWFSRCCDFMDSLHEYLDQSQTVFTFPPIDEKTWNGQALNLKPLHGFPKIE